MAGRTANATKTSSGTKAAAPAKSRTGAKNAVPAAKAAAKKAAATVKKAAAKAAPVRKATATKAAPAKKTATAKTSATKTSAVKTSASAAASKTAAGKATAKKAAPAKKVAPVKAAAPAKKAAPAQKTAPAKKAAPARKTAPAKKTAAATSRPKQPAAAQTLRVRADESPWTAKELKEIRAAIEADVAHLREEISVAEADLVGLMRDAGDGAGDDQADAGSKTFEREQEISVANNAREMLVQNLHAIERLDDGTYGICESCGNPIGKLRLQAAPRATLCMPCKTKQERR